jgi:hypothetical protein
MRYRKCGRGAYAPLELIHHLAYLPAYAHRHPLKRRSWILLGGPAISLNIIIPIWGISHILHSYLNRIRTPPGDCPNSRPRVIWITPIPVTWNALCDETPTRYLHFLAPPFSFHRIEYCLRAARTWIIWCIVRYLLANKNYQPFKRALQNDTDC